jgi:hypothetical protein
MTDKVYCLMKDQHREKHMGSTTFGYYQGEDRVWLSFNDHSPRLWFTRRLVSHLLGPMLLAFEAAAPGHQGGAKASTRAALEHEIALNELLPGERRLPIRQGREAPGLCGAGDPLVCTGVAASFVADHCLLHFDTGEGRRALTMGRVAMHRWLRGLHLVAQHANWCLDVPEWLSRSCLPEAVRVLVQEASAHRPPDLGSGA